MCSNPKPIAQDDFGFTTDEDLPISLKLDKLQSLQYRHFFEKANQTVEESPIAKLDFANFIKPNPFHKSISNITTDSTNAETVGKTLTILDSSPMSKSQCLPESPQLKSARGGLKSKNKAKYLKWHDYMLDCERQGVVPNSKHVEVKFTAPFFRKGQETALQQWDQSRWKEEEQWWEGENWRLTSITYQKPS